MAVPAAALAARKDFGIGHHRPLRAEHATIGQFDMATAEHAGTAMPGRRLLCRSACRNRSRTIRIWRWYSPWKPAQPSVRSPQILAASAPPPASIGSGGVGAGIA
jgi:hypothetical protein